MGSNDDSNQRAPFLPPRRSGPDVRHFVETTGLPQPMARRPKTALIDAALLQDRRTQHLFHGHEDSRPVRLPHLIKRRVSDGLRLGHLATRAHGDGVRRVEARLDRCGSVPGTWSAVTDERIRTLATGCRLARPGQGSTGPCCGLQSKKERPDLTTGPPSCRPRWSGVFVVEHVRIGDRH
jgi:hypothetical protein